MSRRNSYASPDRFTVAAKRAGFAARSVFKLEEIDRRVRLLKPGQRVLDLGAAPGSWSQYIVNKVGPKGHLLAIDLQELGTALPPWATFVQGDALTITNESLALHAPYDVVVSDMAPNTTGNRGADQARSYELFMRALAVAEAYLKVSGAFVGKIFMGEDFPLARKEVKRLFAAEKLIRPEGTRAESYEIFIVGMGRRGEGGAGDAKKGPPP